MDSLTHIALGACIGNAFFRKEFGKKAMLWGAVGQSLPDIDFIAGFWMGTAEELLAHRGFTHSILFALLAAPLLALTTRRLHRSSTISVQKLVLFFLIEIGAHLLLDGFNNYGVGWLEPFSHQRFSFNAMYVADPFFSIWPIVAAIVLWRKKANNPSRKTWWRIGIIMPAFYLAYCCLNKLKVDREVKQILAGQNISYSRYFTTPSPLNNWLWYVVAGNDSGYHVGFRSVFDKGPMDFEFFPRNYHLLQPLEHEEDLHRLIRFSQDFYTAEQWGDTLVFNDLRFGQITGWDTPRERFVFHYYLYHPDTLNLLSNDLVVQRGRFTNWNKKTGMSLLRRIRGVNRKP